MAETKTPEQVARDAHVEALEHELEGYLAKGDTDRADQVRAEIARVQGDAETPAPAKRSKKETATNEPAEKTGE